MLCVPKSRLCAECAMLGVIGWSLRQDMHAISSLMFNLHSLQCAVQQLVAEHVKPVNVSAMVEYLVGTAKCWTLEHAAGLVERHVRSQVAGPGQHEIRDFINAAVKAHDAELDEAEH